MATLQRGKASACSVVDLGSIPGLGRSPGEGNGNPLQYSCLENPMDRGPWQATVHGVTKSRTQLSDFTYFTPLYHGRHCNPSILLGMVLPFLPIKLECLNKAFSIDKEFLNNITSDQETYFIEQKGQHGHIFMGSTGSITYYIIQKLNS